jgi:UDP-glucose:(heptosyl)LPS alpha-1,3-glucosyltransferase
VKIAVVIERIESWRGGAETSSLELAELLAERGHDVHIVTASRRPSTPRLTIHQISADAMIRPRRLQVFVRRAEAFLATQSFDIVHAIAPVPSSDVYQPRGGSILETIERNIELRKGRWRRRIKRAAAAVNFKYRGMIELERRACRADGPVIAAVSQYVADQFERRYGLTPPRVQVVFNGVRAEPPTAEQRSSDRQAIRAQFGLADDAMVLLCVAHNFKLKGIPYVVDALAALRSAGRSNAYALIVGRDNPVPILRRAETQRVADRVLFAGPTQRVSAYFSAADVCVHPTWYDPCSRVVLEAMSRGLPAITTRCNGAAEVIEEGVTGFVIESPDDVGALADRILRLFDGQRATAMGAAAQARRADWSMSRHVDRLIELFEKVMGARSGPAG